MEGPTWSFAFRPFFTLKAKTDLTSVEIALDPCVEMLAPRPDSRQVQATPFYRWVFVLEFVGNPEGIPLTELKVSS